MNITSLLTGLAPERARAGQTGQDARKPKGLPASRSDRVSVSEEAKLRAAELRPRDELEIRREKVEEIKALIDSGEYRIDTAKIAKRIVEEEPEFFLPRSQP